MHMILSQEFMTIAMLHTRTSLINIVLQERNMADPTHLAQHVADRCCKIVKIYLGFEVYREQMPFWHYIE